MAVQPDIGGVILAGGQSKRIGQNKGLLKIGNKTLIEWVAGELEKSLEDILIVSNHADAYRFLNFPIHPDIFPGGALSGVHAGISASRKAYNLVVACDMPFIDARLVDAMSPFVLDHDAVVFESDKGFESLFAIFSKAALEVIEPMLNRNEFAIHDVFSRIRTKSLSTSQAYAIASPHCFFNINYEDDYLRAVKIHEARTLP